MTAFISPPRVLATEACVFQFRHPRFDALDLDRFGGIVQRESALGVAAIRVRRIRLAAHG
jgi:hypothetical protein